MYILFTFPIDQPPRFAFIAPALQKVWNRVVTDDVVHFSRPLPRNLDALLNVEYIVVTLDVSQPPRFAFIALAPRKV